MGRHISTELDVPVTEKDSNGVPSECKSFGGTMCCPDCVW